MARRRFKMPSRHAVQGGYRTAIYLLLPLPVAADPLAPPLPTVPAPVLVLGVVMVPVPVLGAVVGALLAPLPLVLLLVSVWPLLPRLPDGVLAGPVVQSAALVPVQAAKALPASAQPSIAAARWIEIFMTVLLLEQEQRHRRAKVRGPAMNLILREAAIAGEPAIAFSSGNQYRAAHDHALAQILQGGIGVVELALDQRHLVDLAGARHGHHLGHLGRAADHRALHGA
jgi:hypothetical protein